MILVTVAALAAALAAGMLVHRQLREPLEARGVRPWRFRDAFGAAPMVLIGAALLGAACGGVTAAVAGWAPRAWFWAAIPAVGLGALCIALGRFALRKLFD